MGLVKDLPQGHERALVARQFDQAGDDRSRQPVLAHGDPQRQRLGIFAKGSSACHESLLLQAGSRVVGQIRAQPTPEASVRREQSVKDVIGLGLHRHDAQRSDGTRSLHVIDEIVVEQD